MKILAFGGWRCGSDSKSLVCWSFSGSCVQFPGATWWVLLGSGALFSMHAYMKTEHAYTLKNNTYIHIHTYIHTYIRKKIILVLSSCGVLSCTNTVSSRTSCSGSWGPCGSIEWTVVLRSLLSCVPFDPLPKAGRVVHLVQSTPSPSSALCSMEHAASSRCSWSVPGFGHRGAHLRVGGRTPCSLWSPCSPVLLVLHSHVFILGLLFVCVRSLRGVKKWE